MRKSLSILFPILAATAADAAGTPGSWLAPDLAPPASFRSLGAEPIPLVRERAPVASIVFDDRAPDALAAARTVREAIRRTTGATLPLYRELPGQCASNAPALHFGPTALARAHGLAVGSPHPEAFRIVATNGIVHFLGHLRFAAADWCERQLGARRFGGERPVDLTDFPRRANLDADAVDCLDFPVFALRAPWPCDDADWKLFAKCGSSHRGGVNVHAPHAWNREPNTIRDHLDVFALDAEGLRAETPLLCYGNPATLDFYRRRIDDHIAGRRDSGGIVDSRRKLVTVCQWDAPLDCRCPFCQNLLDPSAGPSGSGSPVIWGFFLKSLAGWMKSAHPDYLIAFLPYLNTCRVPPGLDLSREGNCEAMICTMPGLALLKNDDCRRREEELIRDWTRVTGRKAINWHYGCWPADSTRAPYVYGNVIARHYRDTRDLTDGSFVNGGFDFRRFPLSAYVWTRCLWNPDIDVNAVYDSFAERLFGPAARPMRELVRLQEDGWRRQWPDDLLLDRNVFGVSYPPATIAEMKRLVGDALTRTRAGSPERERVLWYASAFEPFFADAAAAAGETPPPPPLVCGSDSPRALVRAFADGQPCRFGTWVTTETTPSGLAFSVLAEEPDASARPLPAPRGDIRRQDTVTLVVNPSADDDAPLVSFLFDLRGRVVARNRDGEFAPCGIRPRITFGEGRWTLDFTIPFGILGVTPAEFARRGVRGNLARWRPSPDGGEWSRLATRGTPHDSDRNALIPFRVKSTAK